MVIKKIVLVKLREGTFFLGGEGLGPQRGGSSGEGEHQKGSHLFVSYSRGG